MRMNRVRMPAAALCLASLLVAAPLAAQQPAPGAAPAAVPSASSVEPAVNTSAPGTLPPTRPAAAAASAAAPAARPAAGPEAGVPTAPRDAAPRRGSRAMDRVELESSQITGNRELPRVLYIVPWRAPEAGDLEGRPVNSLLYELTRPVDRDVFRRENRYFDALQPKSPSGDGSDAAVAPAGPEK